MLRLNKYLFLLLFLGACTCVPDINTPKEVSPTEFANVLFVNSHPDMEELRISLNNKVFIEKLSYKNPDTNYKKAEIGMNELTAENLRDISVAYRSLVDLKKDMSYTVIFYGAENRIDELYLEDTLSTFIPYNSYLRAFHLSPDAPEVIIELKDQYGFSQEHNLSFRERGIISAFPTGPLEINIYDSSNSELLLKMPNIHFKPGMLYTIILRGYYEIGHQNRLNCLVLSKVFNQKFDN